MNTLFEELINQEDVPGNIQWQPSPERSEIFMLKLTSLYPKILLGFTGLMALWSLAYFTTGGSDVMYICAMMIAIVVIYVLIFYLLHRKVAVFVNLLAHSTKGQEIGFDGEALYLAGTVLGLNSYGYTGNQPLLLFMAKRRSPYLRISFSKLRAYGVLNRVLALYPVNGAARTIFLSFDSFQTPSLDALVERLSSHIPVQEVSHLELPRIVPSSLF